MSKHPYDLVKPCTHCPFRNDIEPYLRKAGVRAMRKLLDRGEFYCHETTSKEDNEDDENPSEFCRPDADAKHCAGALILLEKEEAPSQMMRICERISMYDPTALDMDAPVYESWDDMIEAQKQ